MDGRVVTSPLVVIVGPTASGKSALAMEIAEKFDGEIICADSRTIYKYMDIGTAKPTEVDQKAVPHHLIDIIEPSEVFSAAKFKQLALEVIEDIASRGKLPILVGGTGLYIDALLFDYQFAAEGAQRDPINPRHVHKAEEQIRHELRPNTLVVGLNPELEILKERITQRVDMMIEQGFIEEVKTVSNRYGWQAPALLAPGYKAFRSYIENKISLDEAKAEFVRNDYLLARRQRTWFKRNKSIHWLENREDYVAFVTTLLNKKQ